MTAEQVPPDGFRVSNIRGSFVEINGPLYRKDFDDGKVALGFRVEDRHCNPAGVCHGGMLLTLADMQIGFGVVVQSKVPKFLPTINLNGDFVAPANIGDWVQGRTEVHKVTGRLAFASCQLESDDGTLYLRASGIVRIPSDGSALAQMTTHRR